MKIVFATNNAHKLEEVRNILGNKFQVLSLNDIECHVDIPETGKTLEENAMIKAKYVFEHYHISVFADDTGLEVEALGGEPGVYSARYAGGDGHDSEANMKKLLANLKGEENRKARFRDSLYPERRRLGRYSCPGRDGRHSGRRDNGRKEGRVGIRLRPYIPAYRLRQDIRRTRQRHKEQNLS